MRQYKNICTKENFEAEFLYLKLATLIYNKFLGWYDSYDQLCELLAEEGKYAIVGNTLTDAVVYEGTSSCWESTGVLFFQKFIDDFVSSEVTLTDELKRTICVLIGASYGSEGGSGSGSGSGSGGTIDIEKYLKEVGKYLKAGNHISITNNTISCLLEPGDGIAINNNKISCTDTKVFEIVDELPTSNIKDDKIYLLDEGNGKFSQYIYSGGGWNNITPKAETVIPTEGGDITKELILQLLGFDRNNSTQYLRKDGQWVTPPDTNTTYNNATQSEAGLMSALDKKKLDTLLNVTAASLLDYSSDTTTFLRHDGEWATPPNTSYNVATQSSDGLLSAADKTKLDSLTAFNKASILSKLESGQDTTKFLRNDGLWAVPPDNDTTYSPATSTTDGLMSAEDKRKLDSISIDGEGPNLPNEPIINDNAQDDPYGIPENSKLLGANPYTYVKVILQGSLYNSNYSKPQLNAQLGSNIPGCLLALKVAGDYYEELLPTKRMAFKNGEDMYTYESGTAKYFDLDKSIGSSISSIFGGNESNTVEPYLCLGKYSGNTDIGLPATDIIQIDNDSPWTVDLFGTLNNGNCGYIVSRKYTDDNGKERTVSCRHLKLPILDGRPHIVTYLAGANLVQPSNVEFRNYYLLNPTDNYENRLLVHNIPSYEGDGFQVPASDAAYMEDRFNRYYTIYYVTEYKATYSGTLPKQIIYKGVYTPLTTKYYDGTLADGYGPLYGTAYEHFNVTLRRYGNYPKTYGMYSKVSVLNDKAIVTINNEVINVPISPYKELKQNAHRLNWGWLNSYIGSNQVNEGVNTISLKIIYKVELRWPPLVSDYEGMSYFILHAGEEDVTSYSITALENPILIQDNDKPEEPQIEI